MTWTSCDQRERGRERARASKQFVFLVNKSAAGWLFHWHLRSSVILGGKSMWLTVPTFNVFTPCVIWSLLFWPKSSNMDSVLNFQILDHLKLSDGSLMMFAGK